MKTDSDGGSGEDQDGSESHGKVLRLTDQPLFDIFHYIAKDLFFPFPEKGQKIQNVPTFQKRVKGK